eukprot:Cvel_24982.t1-p1 / transcript=Cvel_24982.t1 / gene=Cvel_24982 / organism=Chromera_velia_CCMP2878 / gene_product=hypothetical protein / transcript_product=hypothetical protein / location=Cvel_scaffold2768:1546-2464(-) / protein_length=119 / sequence_SO=supercontig / SO=protein_coding / is_pseudo=false
MRAVATPLPLMLICEFLSGSTTIDHLPGLLRDRSDAFRDISVVAGFDAFVDELITVVEERQSVKEFRRLETIHSFGEAIKASAGRSSLREIVVKDTEPGGCAVNLGDALIGLGCNVDYT